VKVPGAGSGGGSLGGALLDVAEVGDGFGKRGEPSDEQDRGEGWVAGQVRQRAEQPGGLPQLVAGRGRRGDAPVRSTGGPVVEVGGLSQRAAAQKGSGSVQYVGGGPGRVCGSGWVGPGQRADLPCGLGRDPACVVPGGVSFRGGQSAGRGMAGAGPALAELGPGQVRCELGAAVPDGAAVAGGVAGQRDRVPGDLARVLAAVPGPGEDPGGLQAGEELGGAG
jgi:hypothetical protein